MAERRCVRPGCRRSIEDRHGNADLCEECLAESRRSGWRDRQRWRRRDPEWKEKEKVRRRARRAAARAGTRTCADCRADISGRGPRAKRCEDCQKRRKRELARETYRKEVGLPEDRTCETEGCGRSISHRHGNTKHCEECRALRRTKQGRMYMANLRQDPAYRHRNRENWPCRKHLVELLVEQRGRCGICLEPMEADRIDSWVVGRIRPESAGGERVKENCQVVHPECSSRKGASWEGSMEAQVARWAPWKLGPY